MAELGLPKVKACQLVACFELGRRFFLENTGRWPTIRGAEDVYEHLKELRGFKKEVLRGLYLNSRNKLIHDEVISIGTLNANLAHPREVFQPAIEFSAAAVIVAHNHPTGDVEISSDDKKTTQALRAAGEILGIPLIDHVIIGAKSFASLKEQGRCDFAVYPQALSGAFFGCTCMSPKSTSISDARKNIFTIADEVQKPGNYYTLTEKGRSKVVLMSAEEFESWKETIEVLHDFPNLRDDIAQAEKEYSSGDYVTVDDLLAQEGYILMEKQGKYGVRSRSSKKVAKRAGKNR